MNGYAADALVDFTGGVPESLDLTKMELGSPEVQDNLFCDLLDASENRALILCNIAVSFPNKECASAKVTWQLCYKSSLMSRNIKGHYCLQGGAFKT